MNISHTHRKTYAAYLCIQTKSRRHLVSCIYYAEMYNHLNPKNKNKYKDTLICEYCIQQIN